MITVNDLKEKIEEENYKQSLHDDLIVFSGELDNMFKHNHRNKLEYISFLISKRTTITNRIIKHIL